MDAHSNFGYSTVQAPAPGIAGVSLTVAAGQGALFPAAPFNCTVWPSGVQPLASNAEIVRVTAKAGDVFTITRAQEGTAAVNIEAGYQIANTTSVKVFTDIEDTMLQYVAAGGVSCTAPGVVFSNANGVTFGAAGGTVTASVNTAGGGIAASAGAESISNGTLVFSNSNGVTFGLNNSTLTVSHDGLTSQSNQAFSAQGGSSAFQTLGFANSNGITFSNSNGSVVASYTVPSIAGLISAIGLSGGTQSNQVTAIVFSNTNGVSFGVNGSTVTASIAAGAAAGSISAGTTSVALGQAVFSNSNGVTFGLDGSTVTASHNGLTSQSNQAASASNGSFTFQTLNFSNANNVTFGTSGGGIITASVAPSGGGSVNFSAGTTSNNLATIVFSNSNGVTFGLNGSTITASFAPSGGGATFSRFMPFPYYLGLAQIMTNGSLTVMPVDVPNAVQFDRIVFQQILNNATITATQSHTRAFGFYTNNAGTLSLVFSHTDESTWNFSGTVNFSNSFNGHRIQVMTFNSTSLPAGQYYFGLVFSSTFSSTQNAPQFVVNTFFASNFTGIFGEAPNTTIQRTMGAGIFTATTGNIPSSIAISDIEGNPSQAQRIPNWHLALSTV